MALGLRLLLVVTISCLLLGTIAPADGRVPFGVGSAPVVVATGPSGPTVHDGRPTYSPAVPIGVKFAFTGSLSTGTLTQGTIQLSSGSITIGSRQLSLTGVPQAGCGNANIVCTNSNTLSAGDILLTQGFAMGWAACYTSQSVTALSLVFYTGNNAPSCSPTGSSVVFNSTLTCGYYANGTADLVSSSVYINASGSANCSGFGTPYPVSFTESGLTIGVSWAVGLGGVTVSSSSPTIDFSELNGTYGYTVAPEPGYLVSPSSGSVTVDGGAVSIPVTFTAIPPSTFALTFTESGLPSGTAWSVSVEGRALTSTTAELPFSESNGTYTFAVGAVPGYTATPSSGTVTVSGGAPTQSIVFTANATTSPSSSHPPPSFPWTYVILGAVAIAVVAVALVVVLRERRR